MERLHSIVKSETAWDPAYSSVDGADDTRVPECTEGFMVLIKGIEGWLDQSLLSSKGEDRFKSLSLSLYPSLPLSPLPFSLSHTIF